MRLFFLMVLVVLALPAEARTERAYIGSFTNTGNARPGQFGNRGEGLYVTDLDTETGKLSVPRLVAKTPSPTWIVIARGVLYCTNYYHGFADPKFPRGTGSVSAYRIERASGDLTLINQVSVGDAPAHLAVAPGGKFLLVASYDTGTAAVLPIRPDGGLGDYTDLVHPEGAAHPDQAADGPPGNLVGSDQSHARLHAVGFDPSGRYVVMDDAGLDNVLEFRLDADGKLTPMASLPQVPGSAPRHFAFNAKGDVFYNIFEQSSKVTVSHFDAATGAMELRQSISTVPAGFAGSNLGSELLLAKDGRHLYASNRFRDSVMTYDVKADGRLAQAGETQSGSSFTRSIAIDPSGTFLFALAQLGDTITSFRLDPRTGVPKPLNLFAPVGSPVVMVFAPD